MTLHAAYSVHVVQHDAEARHEYTKTRINHQNMSANSPNLGADDISETGKTHSYWVERQAQMQGTDFLLGEFITARMLGSQRLWQVALVSRPVG